MQLCVFMNESKIFVKSPGARWMIVSQAKYVQLLHREALFRNELKTNFGLKVSHASGHSIKVILRCNNVHQSLTVEQ